MINDFDKANALVPKYKAAHVFFTEGKKHIASLPVGSVTFVCSACNPELFNRLTQSKCAKYIKTLREVNIAFLPYERQAFTLDSPDTFFIAYDPSQGSNRTAHLDTIAEQIATLCATLGEYPTIRYRSENERMLEFANAVQQKLNQYKADDATMGEVRAQDDPKEQKFTMPCFREAKKPNRFSCYWTEVLMQCHLYYTN